MGSKILSTYFMNVPQVIANFKIVCQLCKPISRTLSALWRVLFCGICFYSTNLRPRSGADGPLRTLKEARPLTLNELTSFKVGVMCVFFKWPISDENCYKNVCVCARDSIFFVCNKKLSDLAQIF